MKIFSHFVSSAELINQYIVINEKNNDAVMIDIPGCDGKLIELIEKENLNLKAVFITHNHRSHIASLGTLFKIYSPKIYAYFDTVASFKAKEVKDGDIIKEAGFEIHALHVPGHSLDSMCYKIESALFTGDTLESGYISETNTLIEKELLVNSIKEKLLSLDDNTLIFPGHGPLSKIRIEKMFNQDLLEANIMISS